MCGLNSIELQGSLQQNLEEFLRLFSSDEIKASNIDLDQSYYNIKLTFDLKDAPILTIMCQFYDIDENQCAVEFSRLGG